MSSKLLSVSLALAVALVSAAPAMALTMKECSTKYKAAQNAGTLHGMKWKDFRKAECGADAKPAAATAPAGRSAGKTGTKRSTASAPSAPSMRPTAAVFPRAIDPKYSKESPGKARMKTCVDQYNANKARNANGGMKWIEKGDGYWSECNKRLKS